MPPRAKKGTVSVTTDRGMLGLRWRYGGERYRMALGMPDSPLGRHRAKAIASAIELDMAAGTFDTTKEKYRPAPQSAPEQHLGQLTPELFTRFIESRRRAGSGEYGLHTQYGSLLRYLDRYGKPIATPDDAADLLAQIKKGKLQAVSKGCSDRTLNKYISIYRRFAQWAMVNDLIEVDPFRRIEAIRTQRDRESRRPFTDNERRAILAGFEAHQLFRHYLPYVKALFWLGWRPSELIGLRWANVDRSAKTVTIGESLSRDVKGRTRKGTKGGTVRTLSLNTGQWAIIEGQPETNDLVFPGPRGRHMDDDAFCRRQWQPILAAAKVDYRPPYTARHTFATWAKRHGMSDDALAYWMGHKTTRMVQEHYGHLNDEAIAPDLPE